MFPRRIAIIEVVARIERSVPQKLEHTSMQLICSGFRHHIRIAGRAMPNLRLHDARVRLHLLNGINVEVRKRGPAHLRIGSIKPIHREHSRDAALPVHRKLLGKIGSAVRVGHGARCQ